MRIALLSHGYPPTISGVTVVVQKLARAMVRRGHEVTVIAASERGDPYADEDEGVRVVRLPSRPNPFWPENPIPAAPLETLRRIVADTRPDVVHTHDSAVLCLQLLRLRSEIGTPIVSTCHYVPRFVSRYVARGEGSARFVERSVWQYSIRVLDRFDHVVFPTSWQRASFVDHGLRAESSVISNGVDTSRYCPPNGTLDRDVGAEYRLPSRPRALFVGRLAKDKEIDVLIAAVARSSEPAALSLVVVGRGEESERLGALARELGVADRIRFLGFVPEKDLPAIYRACDVFAIASTCEVQSIPALQALATGLPLVAVEAGALPELVLRGVNGALARPGRPADFADALADVLGDDERALRLGAESLKLSRRHTESSTFDAHEALYERLIGSTASRPHARTRPRTAVGEIGPRR